MDIRAGLRYSAWSLKRKLFGYMLLLVILLLLALMAGLLLFGRFDSAGQKAYDTLDLQMEVFQKDVVTHFDDLAAASIRLSEDITEQLETYLIDRGMSFDQLNEAEQEIGQVQEMILGPLQQMLFRENCSGIFVMLDVTVNRAVANAEFSRSGIYLQTSGYKNADESVLLYRGLTEIGKRHEIIPHRKWRLEFRTDLFPNYSDIVSRATLSPEHAYFLTERFTLPGTSEEAMLMVSPIVGADGTFYGLCGYEIRESYFASYHAQPTKIQHLTCLLTAGGELSLDASEGLSCGVAGGYHRPPKGMLDLDSTKNGLLCFVGEELSYMGLEKRVLLSPNNPPYVLAVMMLKPDYDQAVTTSILQNAVLWALLLFFAVSCCLYFSRHYLAPILKGLEQIKSDRREEARSNIPEINDLLVFLAEQDRKHSQTEGALADAKTEMSRLAYARKSEIDPDDYQHFLEGMQTLTKTEREIFDWYLEGKTAKEILEMTGTKESTLKFHNHNILNKLGVSSRKQMLRFAALMNQEEKD